MTTTNWFTKFSFVLTVLGAYAYDIRFGLWMLFCSYGMYLFEVFITFWVGICRFGNEFKFRYKAARFILPYTLGFVAVFVLLCVFNTGRIDLLYLCYFSCFEMLVITIFVLIKSFRNDKKQNLNHSKMTNLGYRKKQKQKSKKGKK